MKPTTQNIYNVLKDSTLLSHFNQLKSNNPSYTIQETTITEAFDSFTRLSELIISTVESNIFDSITITKRAQIWSHVSTIQQQLNQCQKYGFNFANLNVVNLVTSIIQQVNGLIDTTESSNLFAKTIGLEDYKEEVKNLSNVREKYHSLLSSLKELERIKVDINNIFGITLQNNDTISNLLSKADTTTKQLENVSETGNELSKKINESHSQIKEIEKEIEVKKLQISTFAQNIDEYKVQIDELISTVRNLIEKEEEINKLILSAELALNLNSAHGISAAFSSQYETAKNTGFFKIWKLKFNMWIIGATLFILSAIGITVWIASGNFNSDADGLSLIIGRIVAVAISITGATFCAKQYIKLRNIAEDYAYKAVLSKSIIVFTDEIKKKDDNRVAEYITKVLDEIHKDPLRGRDNKEDKNISLDIPQLVEKLVELIKKEK